MLCLKCGLTHQCICHHIPRLDSQLHVGLLMHENELRRETNSGKWVLNCLKNSHSYQWQRQAPCADLGRQLTQPTSQPLLLFPGEQSVEASLAIHDVHQKGLTPKFFLLDGTWQEARKMERKSHWLKDIPRIHINSQQQSHYSLRRNQSRGNLCTLEVVAELLNLTGESEQSQHLLQFFHLYMNVLQADKSGHRWHGLI
jgi:DTW domain-containing protein